MSKKKQKKDNVDETRVLFEDEVDKIEPDLPPPGYKRDEELKRRQDELEQKAEELAAETGKERIDPSKLKPDREIQYYIQRDMLEISNPVPGYIYCWVYTGQGGHFVWTKKAQGWEVVQGDMPECREAMIKEDTTRRIGDVILMRIPEEVYAAIEAREEEKRQRQEFSVTAELQEIGRRYPRVFTVHEDLSKVQFGGRTLADVMERKAAHATARRMAAKRVAMEAIDRKLREGTVPGMEVPGAK